MTTQSDVPAVSPRTQSETVPGMKARVQRARAQLRDRLSECCEVALDSSGHIAEVERTGPCACTAERPTEVTSPGG